MVLSSAGKESVVEWSSKELSIESGLKSRLSVSKLFGIAFAATIEMMKAKKKICMMRVVAEDGLNAMYLSNEAMLY